MKPMAMLRIGAVLLACAVLSVACGVVVARVMRWAAPALSRELTWLHVSKAEIVPGILWIDAVMGMLLLSFTALLIWGLSLMGHAMAQRRAASTRSQQAE